MCKCENCGKEGKFFSNKESWYYIDGHTLCNKCLTTVLKREKTKKQRNIKI